MWPRLSIIARNDGTAQSRTTGKPAGAFWHSDLSYEKEPSDAIFLYAQKVPETGGDTLVANMALAYARLPEATKRPPSDGDHLPAFGKQVLEG